MARGQRFRNNAKREFNKWYRQKQSGGTDPFWTMIGIFAAIYLIMKFYGSIT